MTLYAKPSSGELFYQERVYTVDMSDLSELSSAYDVQGDTIHLADGDTATLSTATRDTLIARWQAADDAHGGTSDPANPNLIAPLAFLERFTVAERAAIRTAAASNDSLADWLDLLRAATEIDLTSQSTTDGMQALVDAGLITSARRDAILTP